MSNRAQIETAISALEAKRSVLGDAVVDAAIAAMQDKLRGSEPGVTDEQRKLVTVLMADLVGFTTLAEHMDPEEILEVQQAYFRAVTGPAEAFGGTVEKYIGDAILVVYGAPTVHEDDPERAVRAGMAMQAALSSLDQRLLRDHGLRLSMRIGVHTGLVVCTVNPAGELLVTGDTVNVASRLEAMAQPGSVLISDDTYRQVGHLCETRPMGLTPVRGRSEPLVAYQVLALRPAAGKGRGITGLDSPLVGREADLRALQEAIERVGIGHGGIVTVVGEAGVGKSRLVAEARKTLRPVAQSPPPSPLWVEGRCLSYSGAVAYSLWRDVLRELFSVEAGDSPQDVSDRLRTRLRSLCRDSFDDVYPYLAQLLSPTQESNASLGREPALGRQVRAGTLRAIAKVIASVADLRPLIIVCEDLHWADPTSLEVLQFLLPLVENRALLLICVLRPSAEPGCQRILASAQGQFSSLCHDIRLDVLSDSDSQTLMNSLLDSAELPAILGKRIVDSSGGNPFFLEELIRSLITSGVLRQDGADGTWRVAEGSLTMSIPSSVQGVLLARIDGLQENARRVLQLAAVIGRIVPYAVLARTSHALRLDDQLLILQREGMIRQRARRPVAEYIFKHHLTQEAAYQGLLRKERASCHRRVAQAMEELYADRIEEHVERLALHWERAGEPARAVRYLMQAGERSQRLGASEEAVEFYRTALRLVEEMAASVVPLHHIYECLGDVYFENLSRNDEALEQYRFFLDLAESDADAARGARKIAGIHMLCGDLDMAEYYYDQALARLASLDFMFEDIRVHCGLAYLWLSRDRLTEAERHAQTSLAIAERLKDTRGLADSFRITGAIAAQRGDMRVALEHDERCLALYRELGDLPRMTQACNNLGDCCRRLGQMDRALAYLDEGLALARRIGDTRDEALLLLTKAELLMDQGRWEQAIEHLQLALPLADASGVVARMILCHRVLGVAHEAIGAFEAAQHHLEVARKLCWDSEHYRYSCDIYLDLAHLSATTGQFDISEQYLRLAEESAGSNPADSCLALLHRTDGYLHVCRGQVDQAIFHLEKSARLLKHTGTSGEFAKTELYLGQAYAARGGEGDKGRACQHLRSAAAIFRQIGADWYVVEAEAALGGVLAVEHEHTGATKAGRA